MHAGVAETVNAPEFPPLSKLLDDIRGLGGLLLVCNPCIKSRGIAPGELVEGAEVVAAARFIAEVTSATNVLTY
jgi:predicted peroxiredoxin